MASAFANGIAFLDKLGVYDVVLPFLLVFTLVYAFLEKTKIYGIEKYWDDVQNKQVTGSRRNLNAMTAFVAAFFVIASSQLVAVINQALGQTVLLLLLIFCFILVVGAFHGEGDSEKGFFLEGGWATTFKIISFIAIAFIFLNALGWLETIYSWILQVWTSDAIASLVLIAIIVGFMFWVTSTPKSGSGSNKKSES